MGLKMCLLFGLITVIILTHESIAQQPTRCFQPIKVGPCKAASPKYAYDSSLGQCVHFIYGGCQKNENNFDTMEDCKATCENHD